MRHFKVSNIKIYFLFFVIPHTTTIYSPDNLLPNILPYGISNTLFSSLDSYLFLILSADIYQYFNLIFFSLFLFSVFCNYLASLLTSRIVLNPFTQLPLPTPISNSLYLPPYFHFILYYLISLIYLFVSPFMLHIIWLIALQTKLFFPFHITCNILSYTTFKTINPY